MWLEKLKQMRGLHSWIKPEGHDTGIKIYNCVAKQKVPFIVRNKNEVSWYTCGPTVYDSCHIGHASCFMKVDIIQKILKNHFNLNLVTAMNITDIDDKIINKAKESRKTIKEISNYYEKEFKEDMDLLGIDKPHFILRVTDNINLIKSFIDDLIHKKCAYKNVDNTVYFNTNTYDNYGKLRNLSKKNDINTGKDNHFALWKAKKDDEPYFESVWGDGRPGWHIECSTLATNLFGSEIDVHAGGIDLQFPHHENEEAQSCAFHMKQQWVNYWLHTGHLHLKDDTKMSKSLKNTISIRELLKSVDAKTFRMACLMSRYQNKMEFSYEYMENARNLINNFKNFTDSCNDYINGYIIASLNSNLIDKLIWEFEPTISNSLMDDFNTPEAIKYLNKVVSTVNDMLHLSAGNSKNRNVAKIVALSNLVVQSLNDFGIQIGDVTQDDSKFVEIMNILNEFRQNVRMEGISGKNQQLLQLCDGVRDDLGQCGIVIKDHGKVSSWSS